VLVDEGGARPTQHAAKPASDIFGERQKQLQEWPGLTGTNGLPKIIRQFGTAPRESGAWRKLERVSAQANPILAVFRRVHASNAPDSRALSFSIFAPLY